MQDEVGIVMEVRDEGDNLLERNFEVGELVEFWEGAFVRGYRTDSGEAAFVKRVEGGGNYELRRYIFEPDGLILQNYPVCTSNPIKV